MYQPYIRGKQFELIGIRELTPTVLLPNAFKISPIIEPVKDSSTLKATLKSLVASEINFTLIVNPQVGNFNIPQRILSILKECVGDHKNFQIGIIFHSRINHSFIIELIKESFGIDISLTIIHNTAFENVTEILHIYKQYFKIKYNVVNLTLTGRRYFRNFERATLIELDDYFTAQTKNADYLKVGESTFSEEHLFYKEEGFEGFSDYLSIGGEYSEGGFLPYAVAIHLAYAEPVTNKIKIKHFVSNSNDDTSDIAGKFEEALDKLIEWCDQTGYNSIAVPEFRRFHENGHFPGLGTLKKLSLMNHIDLILRLI